MNKLKQQFLNMRDATPKHVQWLLLGATFIVVLILLTLIMTGNRSKPAAVVREETPVKVTLSTDTVNWADVTVGKKEKKTISVTSTAPAKVSMGQNKTVAGFSAKTTCTDAVVINAKISCNVFLEYEPTTAAKPETLTLSIYYRGENEPEEMKSAEKVTVILGANAPEPVAKPEPAPAPKPVALPQPEPEDDFDDFVDTEPEYVAPQPAKQIEKEIKSIAPSDPFATEQKVQPKQVVAQTQRPSESCSDFAFPGYDSYGTQIGWIKPERGGYYFYPFADKNCKNATGIYNPDTGIITDINVSGKKIGTDSEHINTALATGVIPTLSESPRAARVSGRTSSGPIGTMGSIKDSAQLKAAPPENVEYDTTDPNAVVSTQPYDRTFILRQYKPIPATIVSDVRADTALDADNLHFPVRATVDRNVYSDNGRTVIIPTGTMLLGYVTGKVPGPYKAIGRMNIKWYQFVLPNGVEFNFASDEPVSADAQGRIGVPGRGSTDYMEQFVMPMLTSIVPAAVNMIAPVADKFVNQIDLDNNTVVQSGTLRSSELAKNEIITAWNQVAQKLLVDMMDNTVPPFTIPAGTRITVYSPNDLMVACTTNEKCMVNRVANTTRPTPKWGATADYNDGSWVGQARSFNLAGMCTTDSKTGALKAKDYALIADELSRTGYSYSTVVAYCQASNYQAINNAKQEALYQNQQSTSNANSIASIKAQGTQAYNEQVLGLKYNDAGAIENPFQTQTAASVEEDVSLKCLDGSNPDANGCCAGEIYTDMGDQGFNCCPETGGDCFPPIL